jgi:hypothetical protein
VTLLETKAEFESINTDLATRIDSLQESLEEEKVARKRKEEEIEQKDKELKYKDQELKQKDTKLDSIQGYLAQLQDLLEKTKQVCRSDEIVLESQSQHCCRQSHSHCNDDLIPFFTDYFFRKYEILRPNMRQNWKH